MSSTLTGKSIIGTESVAGVGEPIHSYNPKTNEPLQDYQSVNDDDFNRAMTLADEAFLEYRELSNETRANFLDTIASEIEADKTNIINQAMTETALPEARLTGELGRTCNQLRLFSSVLRTGEFESIKIETADPERTPVPKPDLRYRKIGLGVVAVFGASNFPLAFSVAGGDTASALAAGCPVVVKAHNAHCGTSELVGQAIVRAIEKCNIPKGVFSLLYGHGNELGQKLVAHPVVQAVGFTGSRVGGLAILKTAQNRPIPIPVYAEMSSINPVYITPSALSQKGESIAKSLVASMNMGAGQFCTSPGVVFLPNGEGADAFIKTASEALSELTPQTMLTEGIAKAFDKGISSLKNNAQTLATGKDTDGNNQCQAHLFVVDGSDFAEKEALTDEVFGSSAVIVRCSDVAQMLTLTEKLEGQLTAAIHSSDNDNVATLKKLLAALERKVGRILFNGFGTGVEVSHAMVHGGPFPATSDSRTTSVGATAIDRFLRPVCYQDVPSQVLPEVLQS